MTKAIALFVSLVLIISLLGCSGEEKTEINAQEMVEFYISGYGNGKSTLEVEYTINPFRDKIASIRNRTDQETAWLAEEVLKNARIEPKKNSSMSEISNGDSIEMTLEYNEKDANKAGIKLINTDFTYEVSGIKDVAKTLIGIDLADIYRITDEIVKPGGTMDNDTYSKNHWEQHIGLTEKWVEWGATYEYKVIEDYYIFENKGGQIATIYELHITGKAQNDEPFGSHRVGDPLDKIVYCVTNTRNVFVEDSKAYSSDTGRLLWTTDSLEKAQEALDEYTKVV